MLGGIGERVLTRVLVLQFVSSSSPSSSYSSLFIYVRGALHTSLCHSLSTHTVGKQDS